MAMKEILAGINPPSDDKMVTMLAIMNALQAAGQSAEKIADWYYRSRGEERDTREEQRRSERFNQEIMGEMRRQQMFQPFGGEVAYQQGSLGRQITKEETDARLQALAEESGKSKAAERAGEISAWGGTAESMGAAKARIEKEATETARDTARLNYDVTKARKIAEADDRKRELDIRNLRTDFVKARLSNPDITPAQTVQEFVSQNVYDDTLLPELRDLAKKEAADVELQAQIDAAKSEREKWDYPETAAENLAGMMDTALAVNPRTGEPDEVSIKKTEAEIADGLRRRAFINFVNKDPDPVSRSVNMQQLYQELDEMGTPGAERVKQLLEDLAVRSDAWRSGKPIEKNYDLNPYIEGPRPNIENLAATALIDYNTGFVDPARLRSANERAFRYSARIAQRASEAGDVGTAQQTMATAVKRFAAPSKYVQQNTLVFPGTKLSREGWLRAVDKQGNMVGPEFQGATATPAVLAALQDMEMKGMKGPLPSVEHATIYPVGPLNRTSPWKRPQEAGLKIGGKIFAGEDATVEMLRIAKQLSQSPIISEQLEREKAARQRAFQSQMPKAMGGYGQ